MSTLGQDVRYGARLLARAPGFTLLAAGVLALGIGALSAIFSVVDAALLRPLPFANPNDLVMLWEAPPNYAHNRVSPLNFQDWHDQNSVFSSLAAVSGSLKTIQTKDGPERLTGQAVTSEFFSLLGITPIAGRAFTAEDDRQKANVVLLSEALWRARLGADPTMIGRALTLDGKPTTVIGIVPARFAILWKADLWTLFTVKRSPEQRQEHYLQVLGKLKPGTSLEQARTDMAVVAGNIARLSPSTNKGWGVSIEPLRSALVGHDLRLTTVVLFAVVGFVLLMACANVANLMLARGSARAREMAVRAALGAGNLRLTRQLITESLLLAVLGGVGGLALAWTAIRLAPAAMPPGSFPPGVHFQLDLRVAAFATIITLFTGVLFGLAPVWQLARVSVANALQSVGSYSTTSGNTKLLGGIATTQIAVGVLIVACAGLLVRTLERLNQVDPGFHAEHVLTMSMAFPLSRYPVPERILPLYQNVAAELSALRGVRAASFGGSLPTDGWQIGQGFEIVGDPEFPEGKGPSAHYQMVGPRYFETLGIPLNAGRSFNDHDNSAAPQVAIVNQEFVRRFLHGRQPVGMHVRVDAMDPSGPKLIEREIVGVMNQVKVEGLGQKDEDPEIYVPILQNPWYWASLAVRTSGDPYAMLRTVKSVIAKYDPELAVSDVRTMDEVASASIAEPRFRARLLSGLAALALSLSAIGVFGVLAFSVAQRRREFGVRMALGAQIRDVLNLVLGRAAKIVVAGIAIGTLGAVALAKSMSALLFGIRPFDLFTFVTAPALLTLVALLAAWIPAMRAARTNPAVVLRQE